MGPFPMNKPQHNQNRQRPGAANSQLWIVCGLIVITMTCHGCRRPWNNGFGNTATAGVPGEHAGDKTLLPNPLSIPVADQDFVWSQLTDELDDYFKIRREERTRVIDNVITEGWIETYPTIGSTIPEKWRSDSTPGYEKIHATLQTVRRWARVRVIPTAGAFQFDVQVFKELEDLEYPQNSTVGESLVFLNATPHFGESEVSDDPFSPQIYGWIPLGRDLSLEQRILSRLQARLTENGDPPAGPLQQLLHH
jgi:hypothetical protein